MDFLHFLPKGVYPERKENFVRFRAMLGYGQLIERARLAAEMSPEELAKRLGRDKTIVYRLEREEQLPSIKHINALVAALPLSAEQLLRACGVHLNPPEATKLPKRLVDLLLPLGPEGWEDLIGFLERLRASGTAQR